LIPVTAGLIVPHGITLALSFFILSTTHVVLGEQVPKCIALRMPEQLILAIARPFRIYCWLTWPMIWFLDRLASGVLCILHVPKHYDADASIHSAEELEILFEASNAAGELNALETTMLKRVLDLKELTLEDVMVPIFEVDAIAEQASLGQLLDVVCNTKHSKLPVFRNTKRTIVGVLHTRDLFDLVRDVLRSLPVMTRLEKMTKTFKLARLIRPVLRVNIKAEPSKVLDEFLKRRIQIAIIVNNDGEMVGMTTFEDLMEHLVGEIYDEYDTPETSAATEAQ
jgi:CBS domain containing-hemolysin-like protein